MKKIFIIAVLLLTPKISFAQTVLDYFTAKEGESTAFLLANEHLNHTAVLMTALTMEQEFSIGQYTAKGDFMLEGEHIGKSNIWIYTYYSKDDPLWQYQVAVIKPPILEGLLVPVEIEVDFSEYGVQFVNSPINVSTWNNSDMFAAKLADMDNFNEVQAAVAAGYFSIVGVGMLTNVYHCVNANEMVWTRIVMNYNMDTVYCCKTNYDDISTFVCNDYVNVDEKNTDINVNIYPNPAKNTIYIANNDDYQISEIVIYDENGMLISTFDNLLTEINVSYFPVGNYFVSVTKNNIKKYYPIIITN